MKITKLITPTLLLLLSGCGWVDSTGRQEVTAAAVVNPTLLLLNSNDSFAIEENTQRTITFNGPSNRISNWSWSLLEGQANIGQCQGINEFDQSIAANSLSQACADGNQCEITVEEVVSNNITQFNITTPHLRTPAALEYSFTATSESGDLIEERQTLCAIAINNAPTAVDDTVFVTRGSLLEVSGDSSESLLLNVEDDNDVRNLSLRIDPTPFAAPRFANSFELFQDGGYIYEPANDAPISINGSISDSFTFVVSDGNKSVNATVNIKIRDFNSAPVQNDAIPEIKVFADDDESDFDIAYLQSYFSDAENDALLFSVLGNSLPQSGNLILTNDGVLEGFATEEDSGLYFVNVSVSDSVETIDASFFLNVVSDRGQNRRPTASDISNKTVTGQFSYDVSVFFNDADDDYLYFTAINLPTGVTITPDGVIIGDASSANTGNWLIRVKAEDGNGGSTDDGFRLRIR